MVMVMCRSWRYGVGIVATVMLLATVVAVFLCSVAWTSLTFAMALIFLMLCAWLSAAVAGLQVVVLAPLFAAAWALVSKMKAVALMMGGDGSRYGGGYGGGTAIIKREPRTTPQRTSLYTLHSPKLEWVLA